MGDTDEEFTLPAATLAAVDALYAKYEGALAAMGATLDDDWQWQLTPTACTAVNHGQGVLLIACHPDPDADDWAAVCGTIRESGFGNGGPGPQRSDPGEPVFDGRRGVNTWRLAIPIPPWARP